MKTHSPTSQDQPRLLIADDDPGSILLLGRVLAGIGEIYFSTSGENTLSSISQIRPDLVLLDAEMPGMNGYEVCAAIKQDESFRHIPVIFVTASTDIDSETRGLRAGAVDFITKPLNPPIVRARIRAHLSLKRRNDERERRVVNIYRALSATNDAILRLHSSFELFPLVCRIAVDHGGMMHAWIGVPGFDGRFASVAEYGRLSGSPYRINVLSKTGNQIDDAPGNVTYKEGRPVVVNDVLNSSALFLWREASLHAGVRSLATCPVQRGGNPYAVLAVYSDQIDAFDDETVQLLYKMAANISFALDNFDREACRHEGLIALQQSEERFRTLFENAGDGIFIADHAGHYIDVNRCGIEMLGYERDELIELSVTDVVDRHERIRVPEAISALRSGKSYLSEWQFVRKDGSTFPGEMNAQFFSGKGLIGILRDVSERREAEERERRLMNIYRTLSATNEAIVHLESEAALLPLVCEIAVECGGLLTAWVGIPGIDHRFIPVASYGKAKDFVNEVIIMSTPDRCEGRGPAGIVFREGGSMVAHDFRHNELTEPWQDAADIYGIQAASTFSIKRGGKPYGIWMVYSDRVDAFDEEIVQLLEEMAANISFALDNIDREARRREAEKALRESEARFRLVADEAPFPMLVHAEDGKVLRINRAWLETTGFGMDDIPTIQEWAEKACQGDADRIRNYFGRKFDVSRQAKGEEYVIRCKNGSERILQFSSSSLGKLADGRRTVISMAIDVTESRKAEEELRLAAMVYQDSSEGMMIMDSAGRIVAVNPAFEKMTGYNSIDIIGKDAQIFKSDEPGDEANRIITEALRSTGYWQGELWSRRKNGELFAARITINTTFQADSSIQRRVLLFSDITAKKQSEEMLWRQANFDALTGLPNRNLFRDHLSQELRKAKRTSAPLALMFLDLDGFKYVNDTLGHDMGDVLLKAAADRLNSCIRESDAVARLGGDEFTVILSELQDTGSVERVAGAILSKLATPFCLGDEIVYVSASIGITLYPEDGTEIEDLLKNADQAMYAAKQEGRNRYHYFTSSMQEAAQMRMRLVNDLRVALDGNQFEVVYQPIVELSSGIIHKAEALIRWQHPTRGLINPLEFIPLAEDTGMIIAFGNWVFHEAAKQAAKWRELHHPAFQVSVNISPVQFRNEGIDSSIWFEHLRALGLPAQGVVVEITEGLLLEATSRVKDQLLAFRDAGIEVALDDFGVGYSSLSYLKKFDIDYLKIDQSFVRNLAEGSDDMALCEAIIVMAHKLGLKVIAEGVETIEQKRLLANAECDYAQGYFFTEPVQADCFEKLLRSDPFAYQELLKM